MLMFLTPYGKYYLKIKIYKLYTNHIENELNIVNILIMKIK